MSRIGISREISELKTSIRALEKRQRYDDQQIHDAFKKVVGITRERLVGNERVIQLAIPLMDRGYTFKDACQAIREEMGE